MADTADHRVQNQFLFTAPYISMGRLYTKMAAVFMNYVMIFTQNDVIENALYGAACGRLIEYCTYACLARGGSLYIVVQVPLYSWLPTNTFRLNDSIYHMQVIIVYKL